MVCPLGEDSRDIYKNKLDKFCFRHYIAYEDFKDLPRRTASDKILHDKVCDIAKNPKYERDQRALASLVYKFYHKKFILLPLAVLKGSYVKPKIS